MKRAKFSSFTRTPSHIFFKISFYFYADFLGILWYFILYKWLVCCSYNPSKSNISRHLDTLRKSLDLYSAHYENTILIGDFNVSIDDPHIESFCESYRFKSLIKDPTCFKNPESPSCIDLISTNNPYSFQNSWVIETGLSDFHKMIVSVTKTMPI